MGLWLWRLIDTSAQTDMKRLQRFDFKFSRYQRPNQDWECGSADACAHCPLGPDSKGQCRATTECKPRKEGDRWNCTRSDSQGGKCAEGPLPDGTCCKAIPPCTPRRSVRSQRKLAVVLVVALTLGAILIALGLPSRNQTFNPGPVIAQHAADGISCDRCHTTAQLTSSAWLASAFTTSSTHASSERCMACHNLGAQPMQPHGLKAEELSLITQKITGSGSVNTAVGAIADHQGNVSCATCHKEHHGRDFDLKKVADSSCQVCHSVQFEGFPNGHPDFKSYPYDRRTRIMFDHNAHISNYFPAAKDQKTVPQGCNSCHVTDSANRLMLARNFEQSCAQCHSDTIVRPGAAGIAILSVPGLDPAFLKARAATLGQWPADADGPLTPFMRYFLMSDAKAQAALETLKGVDLMSLPRSRPELDAAAETLAWATKELIADLVISGHDTIKKRLGVSATGLAGSISPEIIQAFTRAEWIPDLLVEVAAHRAGQALPSKATPKPVATVVVAAPAPVKPAAKATDDILGGDDILADAPAVPVKPVAKTVAKAAALDDDIIDDAPSTPVVSKPVAPAAPKPILGEKWTSGGGWYASNSDYSVRYRITGHADPFVKAWLEYAAAQATTPDALNQFKTLAETNSCTKCHSIDQKPGAGLVVNWHSATTNTQTHKFTKFDHGTHFSLLSEKGCQSCHQIDPAAQYKAAFKDNLNPAVFTSNFQKVNLMNCASCHNPQGAGNSCTLCHNYHIGTFTPTVKSAFNNDKPVSASVPKP